MTRKHNFSAGPAAIPLAVLEQAGAELTDYNGAGMSVMEMSHRGSHFIEIAERAEADVRELLSVPEDYAVLFVQGGATQQFAAVPLNLADTGDAVDYVITGSWGKKAVKEAKIFCDAAVAASSEDDAFAFVPPLSPATFRSDAKYVHITSNETIGGVEYQAAPDTGGIPVVTDMSSSILSRAINVADYGVIYAGAQKNIGPSGLTLVIARRDLLGNARAQTPSMLNWDVHDKAGSMSNTPPTFGWYIAGLTFRWLKELGGVAAMEAINRRKAGMLYELIDSSDFYSNPVQPEFRSLMNVPFTLADPELDKVFLAESANAGLVALKGHRSVGGMRASIYNAVPEEAVAALAEFMREFERQHG
ncbi:MAG: 3-phosphoserine/phosphohydroxythreonine transaminase [Pseudomonadota bacterium]